VPCPRPGKDGCRARRRPRADRTGDRSSSLPMRVAPSPNYRSIFLGSRIFLCCPKKQGATAAYRPLIESALVRDQDHSAWVGGAKSRNCSNHRDDRGISTRPAKCTL
jgi:hypothetical protein